MAGYIMNLNSLESLRECFNRGMYSTILSPPKRNSWQTHHEGTFADFATMKPGDKIFFFIQRKIYGIGELIAPTSDFYDSSSPGEKGDKPHHIIEQCKYKNYPEASTPQELSYSNIKDSLLLDVGEQSVNMRWVCFFKPSPFFFSRGVDMDDVLSSNPQQFKMLRAFWKVSFIKIDDNECQAMLDILLKFNQDALRTPAPKEIFDTKYTTYHKKASTLVESQAYHFNIDEILKPCAQENSFRHEMALEAALLFQLANKDSPTLNVFGEWNYITHQVIASPFKPIDYMDKMDVFGYSFISGFKTKSQFFIAEVKKDIAGIQDLEQLMKYVDFVNSEYSFGDYGMISAFLVAHEFSEELKEDYRELALRRYVSGRRPAQSKAWRNVSLIHYRYNQLAQRVDFFR